MGEYMAPFFKQSKLFVTPLSPLHIGCGCDYEPTDFIFDSKTCCLYNVDLSNVWLSPSVRAQLLNAARKGSIRDIYECVAKNKDDFFVGTKRIVPCTRQIEEAVTKLTSGQDIRHYSIARTAFKQTPDRYDPMIPGTALKGVIHTSLLDRFNAGRKIGKLKVGEIDAMLLGGKMNQSPMRLISVSDFFSSTDLKILVTRAKRVYKKDCRPSRIKQYFETIAMAQYRAFSGTVTLNKPLNISGFPDANKCYSDCREIIRDLNRYYASIFHNEIEFLSQGSASTRLWCKKFKELKDKLQPQIDKDEVALIKIGKNSGVDSLVLHGENVASIRIKKGKPTSRTFDLATTFFASEEQFNGDNAFVPFGWALLELNPESDNRVLKDWCQQVYALSYLSDFDLRNSLARLEELKQAQALKKQVAMEERVQAEERARQEVIRQQQKEEALASMTPQLQRLTLLVEKLQKANTAKPGLPLNKETQELLQEALSWSKEEQHQVAKEIRPLFKKKNLDEGASGKVMKGLLRELEN